jgi:APA family basic amino acid/polyamine antiporter
MTQLVGGLYWVLAAWGVAGAMSFLGALVYAELSSRFPNAGGEYVFLREGFGQTVAFLYGWMRFWIASPASIAAYAVGGTTFLAAVVDLHHPMARHAVALAMIWLLTLLNCTKVRNAGAAQVILTLLKLLLVIGLTAALLIATPNPHLDGGTVSGHGFPGWQAFGAAVLAALWAFDGWNNMPMAGGEVRTPQRTLPAALLIGLLTCLAVYAAANASYFVALPIAEIITANSRDFPAALPVASKAAAATLGDWAVPALSIGFVISAVGAMNGSILTGARVPYAMARDGAFFRWLSDVGHESHVPVPALLVQGAWASLLAMSGSFDQLTDYVVFSSWIFYALCAVVVIRLRSVPSPHIFYRAPGHPFVPGIFIVCALALLINTITTMPEESFVGALIIASGLPVLQRFRRQTKARG